MSNPYLPPSASITSSTGDRRLAVVAASFFSSAFLIPTVFLALGRLRDQGAPTFLLHPKFLLAIVVVSAAGALVAYPSRRWHQFLPVALSPFFGFGFLVAFLEFNYWLTA